ncbi:MAG TPA: PAS domain S-box protein, partial [Sulfuricurvum sp.]|nr:PAS domain S-box protein [Sulfuricurvum sp.]
MKRFTRSILFYPFLVLVLSAVTMTFFYFYLLEKEKSVYIDSTLKEARDDLYLLKNSIETYSLQKDPHKIQGEIQRIAVRSNVESIFIFCPKETLHYSSRKNDIGKPFSALFSSTQIAHYREELHASKAPHIHLENSEYKIDATIPLNYLYLPDKGIVKTGSLIVRYDITYDIRQLTQQLQREMLLFFILLSLIMGLMIFGFYRHFVCKFYHLAETTEQLAGTSVPTRSQKALVGIDDLLEQEQRAVRRLAVLSFIFEKNPDSIIITTADKKIIAANKSFERLFGMREAEVLGKKPEESFSSHLMPKEHYRQMWETLFAQGVWKGEIIDRRSDGTALSLWQSLFTFEEPVSKARYFVG